MKQRLLFLFVFLVTMITGTWADVLPSPVYFNDFSSSSGLTVVGNGTFELTPDPRFGKVFHNDPTVTKAIRTNWLELPSDIFSHSSQTKEMTIGFWVNKMTATDYYWSPLFTAYGNDNVNKSHQWEDSGWPFFCLETRGIMLWNSEGWCDFTAEQNDAGTNKESTVWTDDGKWHYVTMTFTASKAVVYVDGEVLNSWTIADEGLAGLFTQTSLTHFCLGGNQAFGWNDPDPAFAFDNFAVYDKALSAAQIKQVMAAAEPAYSAPTTPLTFEAIAEGTLVVSNPKTGMQYSVNEGEKVTVNTKGETYIYTVAGDRVQFYGNGTSITQYGSDDGTGTTIRGNSGAYNVYGNIMSLVDEYNYNTATAVGDYAFAALFSYNTTLLDASNLLLPATTLGEACYSDLFGGCSSLTAAPALPATTLAANCYRTMFEGCSLTEAPALPATKLGVFCYCFMFQNCTGLTTAPELPATTLAEGCYQSMFENCTSLTTAPVLPATTLAGNCYGMMFRGCTGLTAAPILPATTLAAYCYGEMFGGCTGLTTAPALPATTLATICYHSMFKDCTGLTAAPELPAATLESGCYQSMFSGCTNLASVTCKATDISASDCTTDWLKDVAATGTFTPADNTVAWVKDSPNGIPTGWTRVDVALATPLTIKALTAGTIKVNNPKAGMKYNKKNGTTSGAKGLLAATDTKTAMSGTTEINVDAGDEVEFYGDGTNITSYDGTTISGGTAQCTVYGNIMSLVDEENFATATTLADKAFYGLFLENTNLTDASGLLLPATTLKKECYRRMFEGCTGLTAAPALPATSLVGNCYYSMFSGCTGLTVAPELPATTLAEGCYSWMFYECTSLTTAPALPATTLADDCYNGMFNGCTALTVAPELPATTLAVFCYIEMFRGCTSLTTAPALPATTLAEGCYSYMFGGCTSLTTAPELPATKLAAYCYEGMFSGCTNLAAVTCLATDFSATNCTTDWLNGVAATGTLIVANKDIELPSVPAGWTRKSMNPLDTPLTMKALTAGTIKVNNPMAGMKYSLNGGTKTTMNGTTTINVQAGDEVQFYGDGYGHVIRGGTAECSVYGNIMSLVDEENFATATTLADNAFTALFYENTKLIDASGLLLPATTLKKECYKRMFEGCTGLTEAPTLPATTLANYCYERMFQSCTGLTAAPALPATTLAEDCYYHMFRDCTALTAAPELPATTLAKDCYKAMFSYCTSLTAVPALPATTLAESCYTNMFYGCTSLTAAPELPAATLAKGCYSGMFSGCTALTVAPELPATTLAVSCYAGMFRDCTNLSSVTCLATDISAGGCTTEWLSGVAATGTFTGANNTVAWVKDSESGVPTGWTYNIMVHTHVAGEPQIDDASKVDPTCTVGGSYDEVVYCTVCQAELSRTTYNIEPLGHYYGANGICSRCGETMPGVAPALTIEATSAGTIKVNSPKTGMKYSLNGGTKTAMSGTTEINVNVGDKVRFYGDGTSITSYAGTSIAGGTAECKVYGNIMSLVDEESFTTATTLADNAFNSLFFKNATLTDASGLLLPATTLAEGCYGYMFSNCTSLTAAPTLPATTLANDCYNSMFSGCTSLTTAPVLPATTLANYCYHTMFSNCTSLTAAPELPATTLAEGCYSYMFYRCTSLTAAPELPATTLAENCYGGMFSGCTNLSSVTCLATDISADNCTTDWLKDVAATGVFTPANGDVAWVKNSASGIPTGWTIYMGPTVNTPLTITAMSAGTIVVKDAKDGMRYTLNGGETTIMKGTTTINVATGDRVQLYGNGTRISSYSGTRIIGGTATFAVEGNIMSLVNEENFANATILSGPEAFMALFKDNTKLTDISGLLLPAVKLGASSYNQMFSGCTGLTKAPALPATELGEFCYSGMFSGCTGLTAAPALPATKMADGCYNQMFKGCTALTAAPALPATELAINCYNQMFYGCTGLTAAPALPAMTVEILSYNEMFKGCTGLTAAPTLPATTLAVECYFAMFEGCTGLTAAPALPAATLAEACYGSMFKGCTGLTKAPVLPAAKLVKGCYQHMFQGCAELAAVTCLATDISAENCTYQWLEGVAGTGAFTPANETVAWEKNSNSGIPTGWSGGPATGLNSVNADAKDAVIYDLMGRKVTNARRGVYILNGKKVVRK
ncbi:MAG: leucine-rich repeat protein [Prevotella sp.]|nr:leucine-rich repeat protein [Prevotella sp.]